MTLVRWSPARELASMEIDRLNNMFADLYGNRGAWSPAVDISETSGREYVIQADLPGMKREDIHLSFDNNILTLSGERAADAADGRQRSERFHGPFSRTFTLPHTVDGGRISAAYKDGVLTVRVPRREDAKPRQIEVTEQ